MIRYLASIRSNNADVPKMFNAGRNLVARCVKNHVFTDVLMEPEYDDAIFQVFREVHQFHKNISYCHDVGHLREKGLRVKKFRLRSMLELLKNL